MSKMVRLLFLLGLSLSVGMLGNAHATVDGIDYFPLAVGNTWIYNNSTIMVVDEVHTFIQGSGIRFGNYFAGKSIDTGVAIYGYLQDGIYYDTPSNNVLVLLKNGMDIGESWYIDLNDEPGSSATISFLALETVTVPAGVFLNCIKLEFRKGDVTPSEAYIDYLYFARGIGLVKVERVSPAGPTDGYFLLVTSSDRLAELQSVTIVGPAVHDAEPPLSGIYQLLLP